MILNCDVSDVKFFRNAFSNTINIFTVNNTIIDMIAEVSSANLIITNDTYMSHLGASLKVNNIVVLSNGNHFDRFTNYPKYLSKNHIFIYPFNPIHAVIDYKEEFKNKSNLNINEIKVTTLINFLDNLLKS